MFKSKEEHSIEYYEEKLYKCRETETETLINMGTLYSEEGDYDEALNYFNEAINSYKRLESEEGEAFVLNLIGDIYLSQREIKKSLDYYNDSFRIYDSLNSPLKNDMSEKIKEVKDIHEALESVNNKENNEVQEEVPEEFQMEENYTPDYEMIGIKLESIIKLFESASAYETYSKEKNPMKSLQEIIDTSREIGDMKVEAVTLLMMGNILLKNEDTEIALDYFKKAYEIFELLGDTKGKSISLVLIATVDFIHRDVDKSCSNFRKALETLRKLEDKHAEAIIKDLLNILYNDENYSYK